MKRLLILVAAIVLIPLAALGALFLALVYGSR